MHILSGDIGGTSTRLMLAEINQTDHTYHVQYQQIYACGEFPCLEDILSTFLSEAGCTPDTLQAICLAIAGPVVQGRVKFTNLPWIIDLTLLKTFFQNESVFLINDFEAIGYGVTTLADQDMVTLQTGKPSTNKPKSLIGAGTGLGIALMHQINDQYTVSATEGGHIDFAPVNDIQIALLQYLRQTLPRVSVERLVSGQGIVNIYHFVRDVLLADSPIPEAKVLQQAIKSQTLTAEMISQCAADQDPYAVHTIDLFICIYGAAAGDLALTTLPYGGLYIVGGIAPKLKDQILDGRFMANFHTKGRVSNLLNMIPVYLVTDSLIGLKGAANYARQHS